MKPYFLPKSGKIERALVACKLGEKLGKNKILESLHILITRVKYQKNQINIHFHDALKGNFKYYWPRCMAF